MYEYKCKIIKVIDGDTTDVDIDLGFGVWLKKQRIRFFGIDTPESRTRDLEEKKYGLAAKKYVTDRMPLGSTQTLVTVKDGKGKYGRILGQFKLEDGSILNDNMIAEHHAVAYFGQSKDDIEEEHLVNRELVQL
jgi:micrococcal nuclease|tara:strand:+ start:1863 stop:2264 length:402 start_codon:yes stop_codon:yes gene_type:complete